MARFFYAWELGSNLGHLGAFKPVAERLRDEGHALTLAVRETRYCQVLLGERWEWLQAPRVDGHIDAPAPITYADMLAGVGYSEPAVLMGLVVAWRTLMRLARPQLVFADHAPTAILAARTLGIPVMLFGSGFTLPPRRSPLPVMRPWESVDGATIAKREAAVLGTINSVLSKLDAATLPALHALFEIAEDAMLALPELDQYFDRGSARYWGLLTLQDGGWAGRQRWPEGLGPRLFAYIRGRGPASDAVLSAVHASGCPSIVYFPDADSAVDPAPNICILKHPANMAQMLAEAHIAVLHGTTTAGAFLMAGKPILLVAQHLEQYLLGLRIAHLGAGLVVRADGELGEIRRALDQLLSSPCFSQRANALSEKYRAFDATAVVNSICARAVELAS